MYIIESQMRTIIVCIFQRIEEPFLDAVKITLSDRYTDNMDAIYRLLIKFILQTMNEALSKEISNGQRNS